MGSDRPPLLLSVGDGMGFNSPEQFQSINHLPGRLMRTQVHTNHKPLPPVLLSELDSPPCCFNCHGASGCCQCSSCWATRIIAIVGPGPAGGPACRAPSCSWGTSSLSESLRSRAASSSLSQAGPSESESPRAVGRPLKNQTEMAASLCQP